MPKKLVFVMKVMNGGGAERVISLLTSAAVNRGSDVTLLITHQKKQDSVLGDIDSGVKVISLPDEACKQKTSAFLPKLIMLFARLLGKLGFKEKSSVLKYLSRNYGSVNWLKKYFRKHSDASVVAFLYDSIFYSLLSVTKKNKLIISERGDPCQSLSSKTTVAFLKNEFQKADGVVFQSPDVQKWYLENTSVKGTVIFNPVKPDLPEPYCGERKKRIVNFCRISAQKNLLMLVDAFALFHKDFPDYELDIIGDAVGNGVDGYIKAVNEQIKNNCCENCIHILPSRKDIHEYIKGYAMFVSSSDFEGMSNSMLEAMAPRMKNEVQLPLCVRIGMSHVATSVPKTADAPPNPANEPTVLPVWKSLTSVWMLVITNWKPPRMKAISTTAIIADWAIAAKIILGTITQLPTMIAVLRAKLTDLPRLISKPENQPPAIEPTAAPT